MLRNYLLTAWRHLSNHRLFSAINIFGLSVGLMSCILISLFVTDELSYDRWIPDGERVVRLHTGYLPPDNPPFLTVRSAGRMMEALSAYASREIESGVRLVTSPQTIIQGDRSFAEDIVFADGSFFDVLQFPMAHGNVATAFTRPLDLLVSEAAALKYFGRTDVIGEQLTVCCNRGRTMDVAITGVLKDLPDNTHMELDFLVLMDPSMFDFAPNILNTWTSVNTYTYFKLREGVTPADLKARVDYWLDNESPLREMAPEGMVPTDQMRLNLMPLNDLHLHARADAGNLGDFKPLGDIRMIYAFVAVAALVLAIAAINFMNLSTARASRRAREVALRKVMGASRPQVALQFLGEAVAITLVSLLFALVAVEIVLPLYNEAISRELSLVVLEQPAWLAALLGMTICLGLIAGSYPALFLSSYRPARIMKANQSSEAHGEGTVRSLLVVFQFSVSIGLAVCTMVIYGQTLFARSLDVGYSYEQKLIVSNMNSAAMAPQQQAFKKEIMKLPAVTSVALSSEVPSQDNENNTGFRLVDGAGNTGVNDSVVLNYYNTGYDFFEAYNMNLVAGRTFSEDYGTDLITPIAEEDDQVGTASVIINESAAYQLGFLQPQDAVGKMLRANLFRAGMYDLTVVGVAEDVYFRSIKYDIRPSVFLNSSNAMRVATVSFIGDPAVVGEAVEDTWRQMAPVTPYQARMLDDMIADQYRDEEQQAQLFGTFAALAVIIACLGLFGLASFTAERRTREIGLRKIMGARIRDIVRLLLWQFSIPVLMANIIAWPLAWYLMNGWLSGFSYRIESFYILLASLLAGAGAMLIAWLTVAVRAFRVASASPIRALRYE